jgi:hypothetical protein
MPYYLYDVPCGEIGNVTEDTVKHWMGSLPGLLEGYEPTNIFNADKTGVVYYLQSYPKLRLFSGMTLLPDWLPTTGVVDVSLFTFTVRFVSLCVIVLHSVIK